MRPRCDHPRRFPSSSPSHAAERPVQRSNPARGLHPSPLAFRGVQATSSPPSSTRMAPVSSPPSCAASSWTSASPGRPSMRAAAHPSFGATTVRCGAPGQPIRLTVRRPSTPRPRPTSLPCEPSMRAAITRNSPSTLSSTRAAPVMRTPARALSTSSRRSAVRGGLANTTESPRLPSFPLRREAAAGLRGSRPSADSLASGRSGPSRTHAEAGYAW